MKHTDITNPEALAVIIAENGLTNDIPVNATGTSYASQQEGFPEVTMIPQGSGGEAPHGKDFNGFLKLLSSHIFSIQNGVPVTFNQAVSDAIGGYPNEAVLWYITEGGVRLLQSAKDDNTDNFITDPSVIGTSWVEAIPTVAFVNQGLEKRKLIAYEGNRNVGTVGAEYTLVLTDSDEIISLPIAENTAITIDYSQLTFPKQYATFQLRFYFTDGAKTVGFSAAKNITWIADNPADFSDAKPHWVVVRIDTNADNPIILSDAGAEG